MRQISDRRQRSLPPEEPIVQEPIFGIILKRLREDIIRGVYPPGTPLRMQELAQRFGTSLMPVREALHRLAAEELIVMNPRRGASVCRLDPRHLREIYEFIKVLSGYTARKAAVNMRASDLEQLRRLVEQMDEELTRDDPDVVHYYEMNHRFHDIITARCLNSQFIKAIRTYENFGRMLRYNIKYNRERLRQSNDEHKVMLGCLQDRDAAGVEQVIHLQYDNALSDILSTMR